VLNQSGSDVMIRSRQMGVKRYELNEAQWSRIASLLPGKAGDPGRTAADNRLFVNGVLWVLRSGAHWPDLPERYGKWKSVHTRFTRWAKAGVSGAVSSDH
jgi:transposase